MSRPLQFVDFACGHSSPVRGAGAAVDRPCPACTQQPVPGLEPLTTPRRAPGPELARILGTRRPVYEDNVLTFPTQGESLS